MKKRTWILWIALLPFLSIPFFAQKHSNLSHGVMQSSIHDLEDMGSALFAALQSGDSVALAHLTPTSAEYIRLENLLADSGQNPDAGKFIAMLMTSENHKALRSWMERTSLFQNLRNPWIEGPQKIERKSGIEIWKGVSLWAENKSGERVALPLIRSVIRSEDGFKIYTLLPAERED